jgi:hypothetical protein
MFGVVRAAVHRGRRAGISGSTSTHNSSLINRDGGEDADDDMPGSLRGTAATGQA